MAEVEIPEEEIELLKTAFQFCLQETISSIAGLTIYTAGYLGAQLDDDEIMGRDGALFSETRGSILRASSLISSRPSRNPFRRVTCWFS